MSEKDAKPDLDLICAMPGTKVMIKGNHDYWHGSLSKTRAMLYHNTFFTKMTAMKQGTLSLRERADG